MSVIVSKEDDLKNIALMYSMLYGSDIKIIPVASKPYMALDVNNGDFDITGIVEGNVFNEAVAITIQRYLVALYTPFDVVTGIGSNFMMLTRSLEGLDIDTKIKILKAELLLIGLTIPQIKTVTSIKHNVIDSYTLAFQVNFELITGEWSDFLITGIGG